MGDPQATPFPDWSYAEKKSGGANEAGDFGGVYCHDEKGHKALFKRENNILKVISEAVVGKLLRYLAAATFQNEADFAEVDLVTANVPPNQNETIAIQTDDDNDNTAAQTSTSSLAVSSPLHAIYLRSIFITGDIAELWQVAYRDYGLEPPTSRPTGGGGLLTLISKDYREKNNRLLTKHDLTSAFCQQSALRLVVADFGVHAGNFMVQTNSDTHPKYKLYSIDYGAGAKDLIEALDPFNAWGNKALHQIHKNHLLEYDNKVIRSPAMVGAMLTMSTLSVQTIEDAVARSLADCNLGGRFGLQTLTAFSLHLGMRATAFNNVSDCMNAIESFLVSRLKSRCASLRATAEQLITTLSLPDELKLMIEIGIVDASKIVENRQQALAFVTTESPYRIYCDNGNILAVFKHLDKIHIQECQFDYARLTLKLRHKTQLSKKICVALEALLVPTDAPGHYRAALHYQHALERSYIDRLPDLTCRTVIGVVSDSAVSAKNFITGWESWAVLQWPDASMRPTLIVVVTPQDLSTATKIMQGHLAKHPNMIVFELSEGEASAQSISLFVAKILAAGSASKTQAMQDMHPAIFASLMNLCPQCVLTVSLLDAKRTAGRQAGADRNHKSNDDNDAIEQSATRTKLELHDVHPGTIGVLASRDRSANHRYLNALIPTSPNCSNLSFIYWAIAEQPDIATLPKNVLQQSTLLWPYFSSLHAFLEAVAQYCHYWVTPTVQFAQHDLPRLAWIRGLGRIEQDFYPTHDAFFERATKLQSTYHCEFAIITANRGGKANALRQIGLAKQLKIMNCDPHYQTCIDSALAAFEHGDFLAAKEQLALVLTDYSRRTSLIMIGHAGLMNVVEHIRDMFPLTQFIDCTQEMANQAKNYLVRQAHPRHRDSIVVTDVDSLLLQLNKIVKYTRFWHKSSQHVGAKAVTRYLPQLIKDLRVCLSNPLTTDTEKHGGVVDCVQHGALLYRLFDKKIAGKYIKMLTDIIKLSDARENENVSWDIINNKVSQLIEAICCFHNTEQVPTFDEFQKTLPTVMNFLS